MEKLACLLSSPSGLVVTLRYGRLQLAPYAKVWHTVAVLFRPWRRNGSGGCSPTPLPCMACLLSSWRGEVVMSLYGESGCPIAGCLLPGLGSCCPDLLRSDRGHRIRSEWES